MLRKRQPKVLVLVGSMAIVAVAAFGAADASAAGGPVWIVKGVALAGKEAFTSSGGVFKLTGINNIECNKEEDTGEITGTNPGLDLSTIKFLECHVEGKSGCLAGNVGAETIELAVQSLLVYPHEKPETEEQAYDAFFPDNSNTSENLFAEFTLTGGTSNCGLVNGLKVDVSASGSLVTFDGINKRCGVLAEVGYLNSSHTFVLALAGEEALVGALNSLGEPEEATAWNPEATKFELITCTLEAFGGAALQLGISDIELNSKLTFGWTV